MARKNTGFKPTEEERRTVAMMAAAGIPQERIAPAIRGIDDKTLRKWFRPELERGRDQITTVAVGQLASAVKRGEAWAICFWLKCRAGFQERQTIQVEGEVDIVHILRERYAKIGANVKTHNGDCGREVIKSEAEAFAAGQRTTNQNAPVPGGQ